MPWDAGGFYRKIARLPATSGSGSATFLTTQGSSTADLKDFERITTLISTTEGSLVRVFDGVIIIDEWLAQRNQLSIADEQRIQRISGKALKGSLDNYIFRPYDGASPAVQGDFVWGLEGPGLLQNGGFEASTPLPNGGFELGTSAGWQGTQADDDFANGTIRAVNSAVDARSGDFYGDVSPSAAGGGARRTIGGLTPGDTYTVVGYANEPTAAGDLIRAGIRGASTATHTNAYEEIEVWWAELDNAAQGAGSSDGTYQTFTLTFVAEEDSVELIVVNDDAAPQDFLLDDWSLTGDGPGIEPWRARWHALSGSSVDTVAYSTAQAHTGAASLVFQGTDAAYITDPFGRVRYGLIGVVQDANLTVGRIYTMTAWIRHDGSGDNGANEDFSIIINRKSPVGALQETVDGGFEPGPGSYHMSARTVSIAQNTWTQVSMTFLADSSDVQAEIRFRGSDARSDVGDFVSPNIYVDDVSLHEGFPPAEVGEIGNTLITLGLASDVFGWVDTSSWADSSTDSASVAWPENIALTIPWGSTFGQFLDALVDLAYEWELVPKTPIGEIAAGNPTHDLHVYGPGGRDDDPDVGLLPKAGVTGGASVFRIPEYTRVIIEGADEGWSVVNDASAQADFGILETFTRQTGLGDDATRLIAGQQFLDFEAANRNAVEFNLAATSFHHHPLVDYRPGDTVAMQVPPNLPRELRRVQRVDYTFANPTEYKVVGSRVLAGEAAAYDLVWRMWRRFKREKRPELGGGGGDGGVGGTPTIVVAASNASSLSKSKADTGFVCTGTADHLIIQQAIDLMESVGGTVWLTEGTFTCSGTITMNKSGILRGMGEATFVTNSGSGAAIDATAADVTIRDLSTQVTGASAVTIDIGGQRCLVENCNVSAGGIDVTGFFTIIRGNWVFPDTNIDGITVSAGDVLVEGNRVQISNASTSCFGILINSGNHVRVVNNHVLHQSGT